MRTLGSLVTATRDLLNEASAREWTDAQLRRWVFEGAQDIARRTECLQDRKLITAIAGSQEYTLPDDLVRLYRVEYTPTGETSVYTLEYRDWNTMDGVWWTSQTATQATPELFTMWGFPPQLKFVTYPTPPTAGSFTIFYYRLPHELQTDGSQDAFPVELPEGWHDLTVEYAGYMALRRDADPRWQEFRAIYEERLGDLLTTSVRWTDQAGMITAATGMVPQWLYDEGYG